MAFRKNNNSALFGVALAQGLWTSHFNLFNMSSSLIFCLQSSDISYQILLRKCRQSKVIFIQPRPQKTSLLLWSDRIINCNHCRLSSQYFSLILQLQSCGSLVGRKYPFIPIYTEDFPMSTGLIGMISGYFSSNPVKAILWNSSFVSFLTLKNV